MTFTGYLPGLLLSLAVAALACWLESLLPIHLIGSAVIAMFLGMLINAFHTPGKVLTPGLKFTSKKVLKFAIILLGLSLNIRTILHVGRMSLTVMIFTFQAIWNTTGTTQMTQLIYDEKYKMVSSLLSQIVSGGTARAGVGSAFSLLLMLPPVILFILCQSRIIETMSNSGMK